MRSFFIALLAFGVSGCVSNAHPNSFQATKRPYFDLRQPFYMIAEESLWSGCAEHPAGYQACREYRVNEIYAGLNQWFDYFDEDNRPRAVIVFSREELPANLVNKVIRLRIQADLCGMADETRKAVACYNWKSFSTFLSPTIVFQDPSFITPRIMAHEFGHTLGRVDNDVPKKTGSVMSYDNPTPVLPLDIKMMCRLHRECRMVKRKPGKN